MIFCARDMVYLAEKLRDLLLGEEKVSVSPRSSVVIDDFHLSQETELSHSE